MDPQNALCDFHCPRYEELPAIELYMDQVIQILSQTITALYGAEDAVTSAMINNYVKHKVIPAPVKKKYGREHICRLLFICILKRVFSLSEINTLLVWQRNTCDIVLAYNTFCLELERALCAVFAHTPIPPLGTPEENRREADVMHSMVLAIAHKVYVQRALPSDDASVKDAKGD
jgi:hypothetical protein